MATCACCCGPISPLTEAVCTRCRSILDRKIDGIFAGLAGDPPIPPQRVRFGPGELRVAESWYQRQQRQQEAYFDAMQADVTGAYQWPTRECAGGCGRNVSGPWDKCLRCGSRERHEVKWEESVNG